MLFFGTDMVTKGTGRTRNIQSSLTTHVATMAGKEAGSFAPDEAAPAVLPSSMAVRSLLVGTATTLHTIVNGKRRTAELSVGRKRLKKSWERIPLTISRRNPRGCIGTLITVFAWSSSRRRTAPGRHGSSGRYYGTLDLSVNSRSVGERAVLFREFG